MLRRTTIVHADTRGQTAGGFSRRPGSPSGQRRPGGEHRTIGSAIGPGEVKFKPEEYDGHRQARAFEKKMEREAVHDERREERKGERDETIGRKSREAGP